MIYRIDPSGSWEPFWDSTDIIYDISLDADGAILAASGPDGRLYRIMPNRQASLLSGVGREADPPGWCRSAAAPPSPLRTPAV